VDVQYMRVASGGHRLPQVGNPPSTPRINFVLNALKQMVQQTPAQTAAVNGKS